MKGFHQERHWDFFFWGGGNMTKEKGWVPFIVQRNAEKMGDSWHLFASPITATHIYSNFYPLTFHGAKGVGFSDVIWQ